MKNLAMRVLFLTCHLPYPPVSGGRLRENELLKRITGEVDVHVCAVTKTYEADLRAAERTRRLGRRASLFPAAGHGACFDAAQAAQVACHASSDASAFVDAVVTNGWFDVVHVEGFYLVQHLPRRSPVPVLLVEQNVEFQLWRQRMELATGADERRRAFLQYRLTREAEIRAWRTATACAAVTDEDRSVMRRVTPEVDVTVVPDGADHLALPGHVAAADDRTVVLTGNFGYQPTSDAALWFCSKILPLLEARVPDVRVLLVGTDPPAEVRALARGNVVVTGRVPEIGPYLDQATVVVCPLRVGGGVKVKVLEALRRGKPTVTTSVGAQGLGEGASDAVRIADDAAAFAADVVELLEEPRKAHALARAARAFATTLPTWDDAATALLDCYGDLARIRRRALSRAPG
jgi:polysaccharide biosynthesis protein PslH